MNKKLTESTFLRKVNPQNKHIEDSARPTIYAEDMEGMADNAITVARFPDMTIKRRGQEFYALKGKKVVGYIAPLSDKEIDLTVATGYQRKGIGSRLLEQFRASYPFFQSGGYTVGGLATEKRVHRNRK